MRFLDRFRKGRGKTEVEPVVEAEPAVPAASDETESEISEPSVQIEPGGGNRIRSGASEEEGRAFRSFEKGLTKTRENITEKVEQLIKPVGAWMRILKNWRLYLFRQTWE